MRISLVAGDEDDTYTYKCRLEGLPVGDVDGVDLEEGGWMTGGAMGYMKAIEYFMNYVWFAEMLSGRKLIVTQIMLDSAAAVDLVCEAEERPMEWSRFVERMGLLLGHEMDVSDDEEEGVRKAAPRSRGEVRVCFEA